jgi:hypothetical protein
MPAFQVPNSTYVATSNINPSSFVTVSGSFTVAQSASGDAELAGISNMSTNSFNGTYAAVSGFGVGVFTNSQNCWLTISGTVTAGDHLKPDNNGYGLTAVSTNVAGAIAEESGVSGALIRVKVIPPTTV